MAFYTDEYSVPTLTELKAIVSTIRRDRATILVATPQADYPPSYYTYNLNSTLTELLPVIAVPDDSLGVWIAHNLKYEDTKNPDIVPPLIGMEWVATLTSPDRQVIWRSIGIGAIEDWVPINNNLVIDSIDAFSWNPDFGGQIYYNNSTGEMFAANEPQGNWELINGSGGGGGGYY